jgi:ABC-2 type transport system permease protein
VIRFVGTWTLVRLILRRDRIRLPVWIGALVGLTGYSAAAVQTLYDTPQAQANYAATVGTSGATIAMTGPPTALDTIGGITVFEVEPTALIGIALMTIFLTLRHTRQDEEAGRTELLRAGVLGRNADLAAIGLVQTAASVVVGAGTTLTFLAAGLPTGGSVLFGASTACLGLVFTGVALVAAQVVEHARAATGLALAVLGVAYVIRAVGDVNESWLSWLSPIGWVQQIGAFGDNERWWPLSLALVFALALTVTAGWLTTRRDIGSGLVRPRLGSPDASRWLAGPFGLAFRLQRGALLGWAAGVGLMGVAFGSLGQDVEEMIEGNDELEQIFLQASGGASIVDAYFATVFTITALLATGFTVSSTLRLRSEEGALRAEPLLATPLSRARWTLSSLAVTALGTTIVLVTAGLGAGITYALISADASQVGELTAAMLTYLPATLALGGLAFALFGLAPRATGVAWGVFVVFVVFGWLGELFSLPQWLLDLSPFGVTPQVPVADYDWAPLAGIAAVAGLLVVAGLAGFRRRDLVTE